jgi:ferredoxin
MKRQIISINEEKCDGCSLCIPNCPEGAIQIIDGKARLISDLFCDGLGACIGHCPQEAITIEEREAEPYNEIKVMENVVKHGENTIRAHLEHLEEHGEKEYLNQAINFLKENKIKVKKMEKEKEDEALPCGCPGTALREIKKEKNNSSPTNLSTTQESTLTQWPVQLNLLPSQAPFFNNSDLLVCADCVPFAYPNLHSQLLKRKSLVIGCPKLDDINAYEEKLTEIIKNNDLKSITVAIMEVPCCYGMYSAVENAIKTSGKNIPLIKKTISVNGNID